MLSSIDATFNNVDDFDDDDLLNAVVEQEFNPDPCAATGEAANDLVAARAILLILGEKALTTKPKGDDVDVDVRTTNKRRQRISIS